MKKEYKMYLLFLSALIVLPVLAPILLYLGLETPSKLIYLFYGFICHQFHTRSFHIFDYQYAWCVRDAGIWIGWLLAAFLVTKGYFKNIKWYMLPIFALPMLIDGGIQTIYTMQKLNADGEIIGHVVYASNNLFRFMTGGFLGLGVGSWFARIMWDASRAATDNKQLNIENLKSADKKATSLKRNNLLRDAFRAKTWLGKPLLISMLLLFTIYFLLIQLWSLTSKDYDPTNILDTEPKIQKEDFFERRAHGVCPVEGEEAFNYSCFFK